MTGFDFYTIFRSKNFTLLREKDSTAYFYLQIDNALAEVDFSMQDLGTHRFFQIMALRGWKNVENIYSKLIKNNLKEGISMPLIRGMFHENKVRKTKQREGLIEFISKVENWMISAPIQNDLDVWSSVPFSNSYRHQLLHLTALVIQGKWEPLSDYKDGFAKGDRINFVKEIDEETINKALSMAYDVAYG